MHRAIPVGNKVCAARVRQRKEDERARRLREMKPQIDTRLPETVGMAHLKTNWKRDEILNQRHDTIERDNMIMLQKMQDFAHRQEYTVKKSSSLPTLRCPGGPAQQREYDRIMQSNLQLLGRLRNMRGEIKMKAFEDSYERSKAYVRIGCEYPPPLLVRQPRRRRVASSMMGLPPLGLPGPPPAGSPQPGAVTGEADGANRGRSGALDPDAVAEDLTGAGAELRYVLRQERMLGGTAYSVEMATDGQALAVSVYNAAADHGYEMLINEENHRALVEECSGSYDAIAARLCIDGDRLMVALRSTAECKQRPTQVDDARNRLGDGDDDSVVDIDEESAGSIQGHGGLGDWHSPDVEQPGRKSSRTHDSHAGSVGSGASATSSKRASRERAAPRVVEVAQQTGMRAAPGCDATPSQASSSRVGASSGFGESEPAEEAQVETQQSIPDVDTRARQRRNSLSGNLVNAKMSKAAKHAQVLLSDDVANEHVGSDAGGNDVALVPSGSKRAVAAFNCVAVNRSVDWGPQLTEAFLLLGHPYPNRGWLRSALQSECGGREFLDEDDFVKVVAVYEAHQSSHLDSVFDATSHGSETVSVQHLPGMLARVGIPLMPGASAELMVEVKAAVDKAAFCRIYEDMMTRAGLVFAEHDRLREAFEQHEAPEGHIGEEEMLQALMWHDSLTKLCGGPRVFKALLRKAIRCTNEGWPSLDLEEWREAVAKGERPITVGDDASSVHEGEKKEVLIYATGPAFLAAARALHDQTELGLRKLLLRLKVDPDAGISKGAFLPVLEELGFLGVMPSDVDEFLQKIGLRDVEILDFEQVYTFIVAFCKDGGLTEEEGNDLKEIFDAFDRNRSNTLEIEELAGVIRGLGYQPTMLKMYYFVDMFALSVTSAVDLLEFRNVVAKYVQSSLEGAKKEFAGNRVPATEIGHLLAKVGYDATEDEVKSLIEQAGGEDATINFLEFKRLEVAHRLHVRKALEQNGGLSNAEVARFREYFQQADPTNRGHITQKNMRDFLASMFPDATMNRERHLHFGQLVKEADMDKNGVLDFGEFLWLMHKVTDLEDEESLFKALELKEKLGYTSDEVWEFKELYKWADEDMDGAIDFNELLGLLSRRVPLDNEAKRELKELFTEVRGHDSEGGFDFWEFLMFMRKIQDMNWRGLSGR